MSFDSTSIQPAGTTVTRYMENHSLDLTLTNGDGGDTLAGQLVGIIGNNSVGKITDGSVLPIGVAKTSRGTGKKLAVQSFFCRDLRAVATGSALSAAAFVKPNGVVESDGRPQVVACAASDYCAMVVISGGLQDAEIRVGVLRAPFQLPA